MQFPFTASHQSIAIFFKQKMHNIPATDPAFEPLYEHLKLPEHDHAFVENLIDKPAVLERLSVGAIRVVGDSVLYNGTAIRSSLSVRLLDMLDQGFPAENWARFMERVLMNPSERSRECLFDFLDKWNAPITEDGHFIAFKRVRNDYRDIHSGTMDNSPGQIVSMPREEVNPDPSQTCSRGLHVAATNYLGSYASAHRSRTLACKVDPVDVVAVPRDYNFAKMRVCRYLVLGDSEEALYTNAHKLQVYETPVSAPERSASSEALASLADKALCTDVVTFSQHWQRDVTLEVEEGSFVVPTAFSGEDMPSNKFMVGVVLDVSRLEDGIVADIEWQDGSMTEVATVSNSNPLASDITPVVYIGTPFTDEVEDDEDEDEVCPNCGEQKMNWQYQCEDCEDQQNADDDEQWREIADREDELDHIAETGCTSAGVPATEDQLAMAQVKTFERDGVTYSLPEVKDGIAAHGQRGYSRMTGIPRSTLQEWIKD